MADERQQIPGTDQVLNAPEIALATARLGRQLVKQAVHAAQDKARAGEISPDEVIDEAATMLPKTASSLHRVLNATGVLLHTNLGRAPLSDAAVQALAEAAGTTDVELDLQTGQRGPRGAAAVQALLNAVPTAEAAHVVNNGAAALALVATVFARGKEIVLARGEMVEIGDHFRIPELLEATGARLREVGTTNRVHRQDYEAVLGPDTGFILKVHPSNFVVQGFTSSVPVVELAHLGVPVVADIGSGLLQPHPVLPDEPDATTALRQGASLVTASGDKLLGGPQAGLLLGKADLVHQLRRHPLARALRVDKLTLAALEATITGPPTPTEQALRQDPKTLLARAERLAQELSGAGIAARAQRTEATVGGGGAPGKVLPSAAVTLPERYARPLRTGRPPVLPRVEQGRCVLDLAALPADSDEVLRRAVLEARKCMS
ncbi:L-seryl-tRNA(Sec) selenium transferase [Saccharopolyspora rectivirgula]|uniref:L-seryl-tRNA(Sec) selenium transferase n=1 Tax=Saccharopolyspora rectivirgula TaxID=28042 RepID=A0A073AWY0_9PSEU|nr:L-seryl-tRNA(Sec) selenium transferase [Saccharopolyspora rectivirgula]KEI43841.1 selenocysteine synthase [Saccharopolyspora rectivirgula]